MGGKHHYAPTSVYVKYMKYVHLNKYNNYKKLNMSESRLKIL